MKIHRLHTTQRLPISPEEAWAFFSNPRNLRHITPDWLDFRITNDPPEQMYAGAIITYTVRPLFNLPVRWTTEITQVDEPHLFIDEQRFGPYRMWHHEHHFRALDGGVEVEDLIHYALPFGPLGAVAHTLMVRRQLDEIFSHRRNVLAEKFGTWQPEPVEAAAAG